MLIIARKLWQLFTTRERWQITGLTVMVILMGFAQVISVGSIAPFVSVLVNPESAQSNPWLSYAFESLGFEDTRSFLVFLAAAVFVALIVANSFLALTNYILTRIGWSLQLRLSLRLLEAYLTEPYAAHLNRNSAEAGKNILEEVGRLVGGIVLPILRFLVSLTIGTFLMVALLWANPLLTLLAIAILGGRLQRNLSWRTPDIGSRRGSAHPSKHGPFQDSQ